ncbi:MAG: hypothetical protein HY341_01165 [Candidatus Kerfeldbacteria bacterium]|nr:hypothetical protein [Candidatus Kerfeldbacteria bacterium]
MRQSHLFGSTRRNAPQGATSANHRYLSMGGYIDQLMAGVFSYLPLGLRVMNRIQDIIRGEMQALGAQEVLLPALQPKDLWDTTGRWDLFGREKVMYQFVDHFGHAVGLGPTHEEVVTPLAKRDIVSYRDLPVALYQFQTKFRNEPRPKSGILRGREFLMKDLYSFHATDADLGSYYDAVQDAYRRIFDRCGIGKKTVLTFASGGSFSKYSHEFQTLTPAGEDTIYLCPACRTATNDEIIAEQTACPSCGGPRNAMTAERAIEVGNIFRLKTKFSDAFRLTYTDAEGKAQPVLMGCYGIGIGRVMGAVVEVHHDERGIRWPLSIAPFQAHLIRLGTGTATVRAADELYTALTNATIETLYDDRADVSAGEKFADADLIGIPFRLVISDRTTAAAMVELKPRDADASEQVPTRALASTLAKRLTHAQ